MTADGALTAAQEGGAVLQTVCTARKSRGLGDLGATVPLPLHSRAFTRRTLSFPSLSVTWEMGVAMRRVER